MSYGIVIAKDVMVRTRDGIGLATDVHRPARDGEPVESERFGVALGQDGLDPFARRSSAPLVREREQIANALDDYVELAAHALLRL